MLPAAMAGLPHARTLLLSGHRQLGFLVWEAAQAPSPGAPSVLYFHGWPSSASESRFMAKEAVRLGLPFACMDRPGIGRSGLMPGGLTFRGVAEDAAAICEALGWRRVVFMGTSGGGPYAAACAALLAERGITAGLVLNASMTHTCGPGSTALLQGMDPGNRLGYGLVNYAPLTTRMAIAAGAALARHLALPALDLIMRTSLSAPAATEDRVHSLSLDTPSKDSSTNRGQGERKSLWSLVGVVMSMFGTGMAKADRAALASHASEALPILTSMVTAVFGAAGYGEGLMQDMRLTSRPWTEFSLGAIRCPTLVVQGTDDVNVTVAMARYLAAHIPGTSCPQLRLLWEGARTDACKEQGQVPENTVDEAGSPPGLILAPGEGHLSLLLNCGPCIMRCAKELPGVAGAS